MANSGAGVEDPPRTGLRRPSRDGFERAWSLFIRTVSAVAQTRARENGVDRLGLLAESAANDLQELITGPEARNALDSIIADKSGQTALSIVIEEMEYYAWHYRSADQSIASELEQTESHWGAGQGDALTKAAVDDAEVVIGSIDKILDKLPKMLQKVLHALLEALKLTHGG